MEIYKQKWLSVLSLGLVFSLSSAVSAKAATVSYKPQFNGLGGVGDHAGIDFSPFLSGTNDTWTLGYQFSVDLNGTQNNSKISALGVFASPDDFNNPFLSSNFINVPNGGGSGGYNPPSQVFLPSDVHDVGLFRVNSDGTLIGSGPIRQITIDPGSTTNPNALLGFIERFNTTAIGDFGNMAFLALDDNGNTPTTLDDTYDVFQELGNGTHHFMLAVSFQNDLDQLRIDNPSAAPGSVTVPNTDINGNPPGAFSDPMVELVSNGNPQPQGYFGEGTELVFPDSTTNPNPFTPGSNPFFVVGDVLFGPLPSDFPGVTTGGGSGGGPGGGSGGGPGGDTTIPEPNLIHGLLALAFGGILTRYQKRK